jgi:thymidylate synthase (FAD)
MKLVRPSYEILYVTPNAPQVIERCGRVCYKSEDGITPESSTKFCKMLYDRGHHSVLEHASATVKFIVDRGVSHELVRHRIANFSQESSRYCDYSPTGKKNLGITFVIPPWIKEPIDGEFKREKLYERGFLCSIETDIWLNAMLIAEELYNGLIQHGWKPEQARSVLPHSLKTEIIITANAREWLHIFKLRCAEAAHPQMREVMQPLEKELVPKLFGQYLGANSE